MSVGTGAEDVMFSVGELSRRSGVPVSTLHFYERKGLIQSERTAGNQRRYRREVLRRVALVRIAQQVRIPLAEVRRAMEEELQECGATADDWAHLSARWHNDLTRRIEALEDLRDHFTSCIGCGCLSLEACRMLNPHDVLAGEGPGPRRLIDRHALEGELVK